MTGNYGDLKRADGLRVLAASHVIMAVVLIGVLILQCGQYFAEKSIQTELEEDQKNENNSAKKNM